MPCRFICSSYIYIYGILFILALALLTRRHHHRLSFACLLGCSSSYLLHSPHVRVHTMIGWMQRLHFFPFGMLTRWQTIWCASCSYPSSTIILLYFFFVCLLFLLHSGVEICYVSVRLSSFIAKCPWRFTTQAGIDAPPKSTTNINGIHRTNIHAQISYSQRIYVAYS